MQIIRFSVGDTLQMKKPHPCGSDLMKVARVGSDIRLICVGCSHDIIAPRVKIEKNIRRVIPSDGENSQNGDR